MVKRGDIYFADLSPVVGSEQGGTRPVLVIQNNLGNHFSPTIIVAAITAKMAKPKASDSHWDKSYWNRNRKRLRYPVGADQNDR